MVARRLDFEGILVLTKILEDRSLRSFFEWERDHFTEREEQRLFGFIRRHLREHDTLPYIETVEHELGRELPETPDAYSFYSQQLKRRAMHGVLVPFFGEMREALGSGEPEEFLSIARRALLEAGRFDAGTGAVAVGDAMNDDLDELWRQMQHGVEPGITTGFPSLDRVMLGHQPGDFNLIVSRPNVGKTYVLLKNALAAWNGGASVLIITMEMTVKDMDRRILSMRTGIDLNRIRSGQISTRAMRRLGEEADYIKDVGGLIINSKRNQVSSTRVDDVANLVDQYGPDIVCADGIYMLQSQQAHKAKTDRFTNVAYVGDELRHLALRTQRPIVATSQTNRQAATRHGGSGETIGYSDALFQLGTMIWELVKPEDTNTRILRTIKAREGGWGSLLFNFRFPPNFEEIEWREGDFNPNQPAVNSVNEPV